MNNGVQVSHASPLRLRESWTVAASIDLSGYNDLTVLPKAGRMLGKWSQYGQKICLISVIMIIYPDLSIMIYGFLPQSAGCKPYWNHLGSPGHVGPPRPPSRSLAGSWNLSRFKWTSGPTEIPRPTCRRLKKGKGSGEPRMLGKRILEWRESQRAHLWQKSMGN